MPTRFTHTNLIARDWRRLASFYESVFGCTMIWPQRDLAGKWLDRATGLSDARIRGAHLQLPGYDLDGPTLEIYEYEQLSSRPERRASCFLGMSHYSHENRHRMPSQPSLRSALRVIRVVWRAKPAR